MKKVAAMMMLVMTLLVAPVLVLGSEMSPREELMSEMVGKTYVGTWGSNVHGVGPSVEIHVKDWSAEGLLIDYVVKVPGTRLWNRSPGTEKYVAKATVTGDQCRFTFANVDFSAPLGKKIQAPTELTLYISSSPESSCNMKSK